MNRFLHCFCFILSANGRTAEFFKQFLRSDLSWRRRTVLEPQLAEEQGALEDVTSAWLIFPRHQHQVCVDEDRHLQQPSRPDGTEGRTACQRPEKVRVCLKPSLTFCHPQLFLFSLTYIYKEKCESLFQVSSALRCPVAGNACVRARIILKNHTNTHTTTLLLGIFFLLFAH